MNLFQGLSTLDPAFARDKRSIWMTTQLFNGLVSLDSQLNVRPAIADRWTISEDGLEYRFYLKRGITFHQSEVWGGLPPRSVTATDFVYSFHRICDPTVASSGSWIFKGKIQGLDAFRNEKADRIEGFQALNDSIFVIRLTKPFPPFLSLLAMPYGFVVPREAVDFYGETFRAHPVGTGPFLFHKWEEGHHLILHRNPAYFEEENGHPLPYLDAVSVRFIPSKLSAFVEFLQGKLDLVDGIDDSYRDEILELDGSIKEPYASQYEFEMAPQLNIEYLGFQIDPELEITKGHPLLDLKVRKALNYALDRKKMVTYLLNGMGYPAEAGFVPKGMPGFDPVAVPGYDYNPEKARRLLAEAGYEGGKDFPLLTLYSTPNYAHIAEFVQKSFEHLGVALEVQILQGGALRTEVYGTKVNFWRASWIADYPDPENYLSLFYSPNHAPAGPNTTHFHSSRFDSLYEVAQTITTDSLRFPIYQEMDRLVISQAPVIPLYYDRSLRIFPKNIKGLSGNPMNHLYLKQVQKPKNR